MKKNKTRKKYLEGTLVSSDIWYSNEFIVILSAEEKTKNNLILCWSDKIGEVLISSSDIGIIYKPLVSMFG